MIELIQLAVETTVREYTTYQLVSASIGLACNVGVAVALFFGWRKIMAQRFDGMEKGFFTGLFAAIMLMNLLGVYMNASTFAAPKAMAIHQLIKDIRHD